MKKKIMDGISIKRSFKETVENAAMNYFHTYVNEDGIIRGREERRIKRLAKKDGKLGYPGIDSEGKVMSPYIDMEKEALKETGTKIWSMLQLQEEKNISNMKNLFARIKVLENELKVSESELNSKLEEAPDFSERRPGDEDLDPIHVKKRRTYEYERKIGPYREKVQSIRNEIVNCTMEAEKLLAEITERQNYTRLRSQALFENTRQRIEIYYRWAMTKHPKRAEMPLSVSVELLPAGELTYIAQQKEFLQDAEKNIEYLKHTYDLVLGEEVDQEADENTDSTFIGIRKPTDLHQTRTHIKEVTT